MTPVFEPFDYKNIPDPEQEEKTYIEGAHEFVVFKNSMEICKTGRPRLDVALKIETPEGMAFSFKSFNMPLASDNHKARYMMRTDLKAFADCILMPQAILLSGHIGGDELKGLCGRAFFKKEAWASVQSGKSGFKNTVTGWVTEGIPSEASVPVQQTMEPPPADSDIPF